MSKNINFILILGLICVLLICPGISDQTSDSKENTRTITDMAGREVQIPAHVEKIAIIPIPWASVVYAIDGSADRIAGMNPSAKKLLNSSILGEMAPELYNVPTDFTNPDFVVNIEELKKINPDVVIQWADEEEEIKKIEDAGIPVIAITYGTADQLNGGIELMGKLLEKEDRAAEFTQEINKTLDYLAAKLPAKSDAEKLSVFYIRDTQLKTAGKNSFNDYSFEKTGVNNAAHDMPGQWVNANMEEVIGWNPDIIYIGNFCDLQPSDILENKVKGQDWSNIKAVKNGKVYKDPVGIYRWDPPSVESPLMLKWLAHIQYPDVFNDYTMENEMKEYYKKFFNYELSDEKVREILHLD